MRAVYETTNRVDGYVSLEVSPDLAHEHAGTVAEAKRLWKAVNRPNVMIKVPATPQGIPAIRAAARRRHQRQRHAALQRRRLRGGRGRVARRARDARARTAATSTGRVGRELLREPHRFAARPEDRRASQARRRTRRGAHARPLLGRSRSPTRRSPTSTTSTMKKGARWQDARRKGAMPQRMLWASTGTKNPKFSDVLYVESLIGQETVQTNPAGDLRRVSRPRRRKPTLTDDLVGAQQVMADLGKTGISLRGRDRSPADRRREALQGRVRQAARRGRAARRRGRAAAEGAAAREPARRIAEGGRRARRRLGRRTERAVCLRATRSSGRAATRRAGSAGSSSSSAARRRRALDPGRDDAKARRLHATSCCSAWAARASARKCGRRPSAAARAARSWSCSTRPTRRRSRRRGQDRPRATLFCVQQVRQHARAQHLQGLLLREGEAGRRRARPPSSFLA